MTVSRGIARLAGWLGVALLLSANAHADQGNIVASTLNRVVLTAGLALAAFIALVWWLIRKK